MFRSNGIQSIDLQAKKGASKWGRVERRMGGTTTRRQARLAVDIFNNDLESTREKIQNKKSKKEKEKRFLKYTFSNDQGARLFLC